MDDVNSVDDMDGSMETIEQSPGGVSRRDMIKASVIAGGLVWSAPVLLAGRASAQPSTCCPPGFEAAFAVKFTVGNNQGNCGSSCLDTAARENLACSSQFLNCLFADAIIQSTVTNMTAMITLNTNVRLISAAVKTNKYCFITSCETPHTLSRTPGDAGAAANFCPPSGSTACPGVLIPPNRIWVPTVAPPTTTIQVALQNGDFSGNSGITHVEIFVCVNSVVTGMCH